MDSFEKAALRHTRVRGLVHGVDMEIKDWQIDDGDDDRPVQRFRGTEAEVCKHARYLANAWDVRCVTVFEVGGDGMFDVAAP